MIVQFEKIALDVVVDVQEDQATDAAEERRLQHHPDERVQTPAQVPAGPVHHAGGRPVAVDAVRVRHELPGQLVRVRRRLVPDRLHARRPGARERGQPELGPVHNQHANVHGQFPVQRGDATHHRLRLPDGHRGVFGRHRVLLSPEHRGTDGSGSCVRRPGRV